MNALKIQMGTDTMVIAFSDCAERRKEIETGLSYGFEYPFELEVVENTAAEIAVRLKFAGDFGHPDLDLSWALGLVGRLNIKDFYFSSHFHNSVMDPSLVRGDGKEIDSPESGSYSVNACPNADKRIYPAADTSNPRRVDLPLAEAVDPSFFGN